MTKYKVLVRFNEIMEVNANSEAEALKRAWENLVFLKRINTTDPVDFSIIEETGE